MYEMGKTYEGSKKIFNLVNSLDFYPSHGRKFLDSKIDDLENTHNHILKIILLV